MINEKIEYAAGMLANFGGEIGDVKLLSKAAAAIDGGESLRVLTLAAFAREGIQQTMSLCFESVRTASDDSYGSVERAVLDLLRDKDIFTPQLVSQNPVVLGEVSRCLKYPQLLAVIEDVWSPVYDKDDANLLWRINFSKADRATAQRLSKRADVSQVYLVDMLGHIESIEALEVFVESMTPEAVAKCIPRVYETIDQTSMWGNSEEDAVMLVLLNKHLKHDSSAVEFAGNFLSEIVKRRRDFRDQVSSAFMHFAELAKTLGRLDDPIVFGEMAKTGLNEMSVENLTYLLDSGMPATLFVPETKEEDLTFIHLIEHANFDQMEVLAPRMSQEQKDDFSRYKLPWVRSLGGLSNYSGGSAFDGSCLDRNTLTTLHRCGFDLGMTYPDGNGGTHRLHQIGSFRDRFNSSCVFTMLHALGVYPKDLRFGSTHGVGPLHVAADANDAAAIRALVELGYDIDEHSTHCDTPLIIAAKSASRFAFEELLQLGADTGIKARTGASLMQLVRDDELKRLVKSARTSASVVRGMSSDASLSESRSVASDPSIL